MQFVRRCYGLRGIYGRFDSKIWFEIESDGRFDSRFDSNAKNDSQVPKTDGQTDRGTQRIYCADKYLHTERKTKKEAEDTDEQGKQRLVAA